MNEGRKGSMRKENEKARIDIREGPPKKRRGRVTKDQRIAKLERQNHTRKCVRERRNRKGRRG